MPLRRSPAARTLLPYAVSLLVLAGCGDTLVLPTDPATLRIAGSGNGSGTVSGGAQPALECQIIGGTAGAGACEGTYAAGTAITLEARPANGSRFTGWFGPCNGTSACSVSLTDSAQVVASFELAIFNLTVVGAGTGTGTVRSQTGSSVAIACTITAGRSGTTGCDGTYPLAADRVTLTATAANGSTFSGWGGDCTGTATCIVTLDQAHLVTAAFIPRR